MDNGQLLPQYILDSISDGVYVTNPDRKILFWNKAAESITGWKSDEVVGSHCYDEILRHEDADGHKLCSEEYCPLNRSIKTNSSSDLPLNVYAISKSGKRIPLQVSTAPIHNSKGEVVGGVEVFRSVKEQQIELGQARRIQEEMERFELPDDNRISFRHYSHPLEMVGGDFHRVIALDDQRYALFIGDVMGHGIPAALHTMYLRTLFERHEKLLSRPHQFLTTVNNSLRHLFGNSNSFAASVACVVDLSCNRFTYSFAGIPAFIHVDVSGKGTVVKHPGLPLGILEDGEYEEGSIEIKAGERILLFTDGALEIFSEDGSLLGENGLCDLLMSNGYPHSLDFDEIELKLLEYGNMVHLPDDLTLIEMTCLK